MMVAPFTQASARQRADAENASDAIAVSMSMTQPHANLLQTNVRPSEDRYIVSDDEATDTFAFIVSEFDKWIAINPRSPEYCAKELELVNSETTRVMCEAAQNQGATVYGVDFNRIVGRAHDANAAQTNVAMYTADADRQLMQQQQQQHQQQPASFNLLPMNLKAVKTLLVARLKQAQDVLKYNYILDEESCKDMMSKTAVACHRIICAFDRISLWVSSYTSNADLMSTSSMELVALQSQEVLEKPWITLLLLLSARLKAVGLKRSDNRSKPDEYLYRERWFGAQRSHHWERSSVTFEKWLNTETSLAFGPDQLTMWIQVNDMAGAKRMLVSHFMTSCDDYQLPSVCPTKGLFSFRNGIYNMMTNTFVHFGSALYKKLYISACVYNSFDTVFPDEGYSRETGAYDWERNGLVYDPSTRLLVPGSPIPDGHWSRIQVDFLDAFLEAQTSFDLATTRMFLFSLGRTLRPVYHDNHQYGLFILGDPAKGKSKLLEQLLHNIPFHLRGIVPNTVEKVFGFMDFLNRDGSPAVDIAVAFEINRHFAGSSAQMNSMVVGESVSTAVKNEAAKVAERWEIPWICAGNTWFCFSSGEIPPVARRWLTVICEETPVGEVPTEAGFERAAGHFLKKINLAFFEQKRQMQAMKHSTDADVRRKGMSAYIWDHAPRYFHEKKRMVLSTVDYVYEMMANPLWLVQTDDPGDIVSLDTICAAARFYRIAIKHADIKTPMPPAKNVKRAFQASFTLPVHVYTTTTTTGNLNKPDLCDKYLSPGEEYVRGFKFGPDENMRHGIKAARGSMEEAARALASVGDHVRGLGIVDNQGLVPSVESGGGGSGGDSVSRGGGGGDVPFRSGGGFRSRNGQQSAAPPPTHTLTNAEPFSGYNTDWTAMPNTATTSAAVVRPTRAPGAPLPSIAMEFDDDA
jgi:hypothetical protein